MTRHNPGVRWVRQGRSGFWYRLKINGEDRGYVTRTKTEWYWVAERWVASEIILDGAGYTHTLLQAKAALLKELGVAQASAVSA